MSSLSFNVAHCDFVFMCTVYSLLLGLIVGLLVLELIKDELSGTVSTITACAL